MPLNMELKSTEIQSKALRFSIEAEGVEVGRVYLYLIKNDLHDVPYGLIDDLFVAETHRSQGIGRQLIEKVIASAREQHCSKLIATSRYSREEVHAWYLRLGFKDWGREFRMDF